MRSAPETHRPATSTRRTTRNVADFDARFPAGVPSVIGCDRLSIDGDVRFGPDVVLRGSIALKHAGEQQLVVPAGTELIS